MPNLTTFSLAARLASLQELAASTPALMVEEIGGFIPLASPAASEISDLKSQITYSLPRLTFSGPCAPHDTPLNIGIFGGLHGDEPASTDAVFALAERLVAEPALATGYELTLYPVANPTGLEDGTRTNRAGIDLNREFWLNPPSLQPEVRLLENELRSRRFDGLITLHADDTSEGIYGYTHGHILNEALLEPALRAASLVLPRDRRATIDGFAASDSKISRCFTGILASPPDQRPKPFDLIFETPGLAPHDRQVEAAVLALETILDEYRVFLAHAQYL